MAIQLKKSPADIVYQAFYFLIWLGSLLYIYVCLKPPSFLVVCCINTILYPSVISKNYKFIRKTLIYYILIRLNPKLSIENGFITISNLSDFKKIRVKHYKWYACFCCYKI
jgi:hypothetical protein